MLCGPPPPPDPPVPAVTEPPPRPPPIDVTVEKTESDPFVPTAPPTPTVTV